MDFGNFNESKDTLAKHGISIKRNDGSVGGMIMFDTDDIIKYLEKQTCSGLTRLQRLSTLLTMSGLGGVDYCAERSVNKWVGENKHLFNELPKQHQERICGFDCFVYVNNFGKGKAEHEEINKYVKEECSMDYTSEEFKLADKYDDGMMWFWVGEY